MASIDSLIFNAQQYAIAVLNASKVALDEAIFAANGIGSAVVVDAPKLTIAPPKPGDPGEVPQYAGSVFADPGLAATDPSADLAAIPILDLSGDPGTAPAVLDYREPTNRPEGAAGDPALLADVPKVEDLPDVPDAPDLLAEIRGIIAPTITQIVIPAAPAYQEPAFQGTRPLAPPAPPTGLDAALRQQYETMLPVMREAIVTELDDFVDREFPSFRTGLAAIEARLERYLAGGTALTDEVQDQIIGRAQTASDAEYRRGRDKVMRDAARKGHVLMGATIAAQLRDNDMARRDGNAQAARELSVKIAEMEQQNLQFAVSASSTLRATMLTAAMNYYSGLIQINGQAIQYAISVVDQIVKVYDLAVKYAEIQARLYEAEATVYTAKVRGALGAIEAYTAEVRGLEAQANVDTARVSAYKARIDAVQAEANVYRAQIDGIMAQASMERLKIDLYRARVDAYGSQVSAYVAQWNGYKAAVDGEAARVSASAEQVRGFSAQAQAYGEVIRARSAQIDGIARGNESRVNAYRGSVDAYRAKVAALADSSRAQIESFNATMSSYNAKANAISERSRADIAHYSAALQGVVSTFEMQFKLLHEFHELTIARASAIAQLSSAAGGNYGRVASAALSGLNTLVGQIAQQNT